MEEKLSIEEFSMMIEQFGFAKKNVCLQKAGKKQVRIKRKIMTRPNVSQGIPDLARKVGCLLNGLGKQNCNFLEANPLRRRHDH